MPRGSKAIVPHRRRRALKTDYQKRLRLLRSGKVRLVIRKSVKNMVCQLVEYQSAGDKTLFTADSKELVKFGWKAGTGNVPAAYLTGLLCGARAKGKVGEAVLDAGLYRSTRGGRIYAALRGAADAGLKVPFSEEIIPSEDRLKGQHISAYAGHLKKESATVYKKMFSGYAKAKVAPEKLPQHFEEVKAKILKG
jgi:large subunit ribosomal protein L18